MYHTTPGATVWLPVKGASSYQVSDKGEIRSVDRVIEMKRTMATSITANLCEKILSPFDNGPYKRIRLIDGGPNKLVHRIVWETFRGEIPEGLQVRHLNGNPQDNRLDNLALGTAKDNADDRQRHGTVARGERNGNSKLTRDIVKCIRETDMSNKEAAALYGVTTKTIYNVKSGKAWGHVS